MVERTKIISFKSLLYLNALVLTILDLFGVLVWLWCEFQKYLITFKKNVNDRDDFHIIKSLLLPLSQFEAISIAAACCFYPVSDMTYPIKTRDLLSLMKLNYQIFKSNPELKIWILHLSCNMKTSGRKRDRSLDTIWWFINFSTDQTRSGLQLIFD